MTQPPQDSKEQISTLADRLMRRYQQMCIRRDGWRQIYWMLSKYLLMRPVWFGDTSVPYRTPRLSVRDVHDDVSVTAARTCATALGGALWPNTAESFELHPHMPGSLAADDDFILQSEEVKNYFERVTKLVRSAIDSADAGFHPAWAEHLSDQVIFGTSGIIGTENEDDDDCPVRFHCGSIETCVVDEGARGRIDTVYFEYLYTARQVVEIYGIENCSERTRDLYKSGREDSWIKVIHAIEKRMLVDKSADPSEKRNKPYMSVHMEYDTKEILKDDGMDECTAFITRFSKRPNEILGRSLGMEALATVKELNAIRKGYTKALDKMLDPPMGIHYDQVGGGGQVNLGAGAKVAYYDTGQLPQGRKPIEKLYDIPEPQTATARLEQLEELIQVKFLIDRLLDFNNKTRMTKGEADMRMDFRNQALGDIFSRQIVELLNPLISWVVRTMWRRGLLGLHPVKDAARIQQVEARGLKPLVIPQPVLKLVEKDKLPFKVVFISPAARAMKADSLLGLEKLTNFVMTYVNGGTPDVIDNIDTDEAIREYQKLCGAPLHVINGKDKVKKNRKNRMAQQAQQMQQNAQEQQATIEDKKAKAAKNYAAAGVPGLGLQQGGADSAA